MKLYQLNKTVLQIKPRGALFIKNLSANTTDQPKNAFLNIRGRIVATFDQLKIDEDEMWVVIEASTTQELLAHLEKYARLNQTVLQPLDQHVYYDLEGCDLLSGDQKTLPQKTGRLILSSRKLENTVSDEEFLLFRLKNGIPIHGIDYRDTLILNVHEEDFVSFTKGCYQGQEPVAMVHGRSKPRWKLVVRCEDELSETERLKMTSRIKDLQTGKVMGFIFLPNDS